jgi:hypothetical protein
VIRGSEILNVLTTEKGFRNSFRGPFSFAVGLLVFCGNAVYAADGEPASAGSVETLD